MGTVRSNFYKVQGSEVQRLGPALGKPEASAGTQSRRCKAHIARVRRMLLAALEQRPVGSAGVGGATHTPLTCE